MLLPISGPWQVRWVGVRRMASHRETPSTKAHEQILDFQKNSGQIIWSPERWLMPPWSLLFASPIATRTLTAVDPDCDPGARAPIPQPHPEERCAASRLEGWSSSQPRCRPLERPSRRRASRGSSGRGRLVTYKMASRPAQPFEKAQFAEGKSLDFASVRLGFSFPKAWIFLPPLPAEG